MSYTAAEPRLVLQRVRGAVRVSFQPDDERLQQSLLGQGVIGTRASPHDPGTASIHFHHASGRMGGMPGMWGYVTGGMGLVSFLLCDIA